MRDELVNSQGCVFDRDEFETREEAFDWAEDRSGDYRLNELTDDDCVTVARWLDNIRQEE